MSEIPNHHQDPDFEKPDEAENKGDEASRSGAPLTPDEIETHLRSNTDIFDKAEGDARELIGAKLKGIQRPNVSPLSQDEVIDATESNTTLFNEADEEARSLIRQKINESDKRMYDHSSYTVAQRIKELVQKVRNVFRLPQSKN